MRNMKIEVSIKFSESEEAVTGSVINDRKDEGVFSLILDRQAEFDIDGLENALLRTSFPAMRDAISKHLEGASKKRQTIVLC